LLNNNTFDTEKEVNQLSTTLSSKKDTHLWTATVPPMQGSRETCAASSLCLLLASNAFGKDTWSDAAEIIGFMCIQLKKGAHRFHQQKGSTPTHLVTHI